MSKFNQQKFNNLILDNWIIWFFEEAIKYKSWRMWNYYINWRNITEDVFLIDELTDLILAFAQDLGLNPDCFYWVPEWGTKTAVITQYKWAKMQKDFWKWSHVLPMWRAKPKDHWAPKDKFFVWMPRWKTVIIEDTITTWLSLITTIDSMLEAWIQIEAVIWLTDRNEKRDDGKTPWQVIEEKWLKYYAISNAVDLLPEAFERFKPSENVRKLVKEYFEKYGTKELEI